MVFWKFTDEENAQTARLGELKQMFPVILSAVSKLDEPK